MKRFPGKPGVFFQKLQRLEASPVSGQGRLCVVSQMRLQNVIPDGGLACVLVCLRPLVIWEKALFGIMSFKQISREENASFLCLSWTTSGVQSHIWGSR